MNRLYGAIIKSMGGKYLVYIIQFASLMVLARLFTPEIFGLIAAVQVFYFFFQLVAEGGLGPAIIGLRQMNPVDRDGVFGLTVVSGIVLCLLFLLLGPVLSRFYSMPGVSIVVPYVAIGLMFNAWSIIPTAILQRQQAFFRLAFSGIFSEIISLFFILVARQYLSPLHSLSLRLPLISAINAASVYFFCKNSDFGRPKFGGNFKSIKPLLHVSGYQFGFNILNYFSRNLDNILVGKYLGASFLGIYDRSYQLMRYPLQLLTFAMTPAIQPVLRDHSDDPILVKKVHDDLTFKLSLLGCLCAALIYIFAERIVVISFGHQWLPAVPIIRILSLTIPVQVVSSTSGSFFQTFQRTDLLFFCGIFSIIANVSAIVLGVSRGNLNAICWGLFVSFHINFFQTYFVLYKHILRGGYGKFLLRMIPSGLGVIMLILGNLLFKIN